MTLSFLAGLILGFGMGALALDSYKRSLVLTARTHQSELINGEWYTIKPEKDSSS